MNAVLFEYPIEDVARLLPHSGHMVLLDRVTEYTPDYVCAEAWVGNTHILAVDGSLPCLAAMEIMAQCIGAYAGIKALSAGEKVRLGFLLGTRKLELFADNIPSGTLLSVRADVSIHDPAGMSVFDCELRWQTAEQADLLPQDKLLAKASLNVYSPKENHAV